MTHWLKASVIPGSTWVKVSYRTFRRAADRAGMQRDTKDARVTAWQHDDGVSGRTTFDGEMPDCSASTGRETT